MARASKKIAKKKKKTTSGVKSKLAAADTLDKIDFHYIKGPDFRAIHVDGAIGGIAPSGILHIATYSERMAIPNAISHSVEPDGTLGPEISRQSKTGVVRQMEVDLFLTESTAKNLKVWLDGKLEEFESRRANLEKGKSK